MADETKRPQDNEFLGLEDNDEIDYWTTKFGVSVRPPDGAMSDGRSHEMLAWLRRLPPPDRLAMMYAIADVFPIIRIVPAWKAETKAALAELKPTPREHDDIMIKGSRISRRLKRRLKADELDR